MIVEKYDPIEWENDPSTASPISAENLNKMDEAIKYNRDRLTDINDTLKGGGDVDWQTIVDAEKNAKEAKEAADKAVAISGADIATVNKVGLVKPDASNFVIDRSGKLDLAGGVNITDLASSAADSATKVERHSAAIDSLEKAEKAVDKAIGNIELVAKGIVEGRLVASGDYYQLESGAMYLLFVNTHLSTTGAYRGAQAYAVMAAQSIGSGSTAQSIARAVPLGAVGSIGCNLSQTYATIGTGEYVSRLGIGSCTTACRVRYSLYKILGSEDDFA